MSQDEASRYMDRVEGASVEMILEALRQCPPEKRLATMVFACHCALQLRTVSVKVGQVQKSPFLRELFEARSWLDLVSPANVPNRVPPKTDP